MSATPRVLAVAAVDATRIASTAGLFETWQQLEVKPLGTGKSFRALFGHGDDTFRRLDRQTRALVLATEALRLEELLTAPEREAMAIVAETACGSLEVDLRYTRSLEAEMPHGAIFPYTLQSTCLGDVALRHGLRGPTICLSVAPEGRGEALRETERLLAFGEARHVLCATVDALDAERPTTERSLRAVVAVVAAADVPAEPVAAWPTGAADPFVALAEACSDRSLS